MSFAALLTVFPVKVCSIMQGASTLAGVVGALVNALFYYLTLGHALGVAKGSAIHAWDR